MSFGRAKAVEEVAVVRSFLSFSSSLLSLFLSSSSSSFSSSSPPSSFLLVVSASEATALILVLMSANLPFKRATFCSSYVTFSCSLFC
ncbi:hypothetical protein BC941DRAFT_441000 [Chlamydoabsidia padenii]|nr:hypothetical protein BC941DRAFT_441000 [Chlamydoabsidia padenii]